MASVIDQYLLSFDIDEELKNILEEIYLQNAIGPDDVENCEVRKKLTSWLQCPPLITTVRVNLLKIDLSQAKTKLQEYLNEEYPEKFCVEEHPILSDLLVIPSPPPDNDISHERPQVIVDIRCGVAVLRGANIYAPGILAAPSNMKAGQIVSVCVDIKGKCRRGLTKDFEEAKIFIGNGEAVVSRKEIFTTNSPKGLAVKMTSRLFPCPSFDSSLSEIIFLQNFPSMLCSHVLNPQPGEWVLDMCAAPGGKTTHVATLMKNQGKVIALDKTEAKIQKILTNTTRMNLTCVEVFAFNAVKALDVTLDIIDRSEIRTSPGPPPYPIETFDRVLLDAPCSALGQRPQLALNMSRSQLKSYPPLQRKLFSTAVQLLKGGGILVYSTCTFTLTENEEIVQWALKTFPCLQLEAQHPCVGNCGLPVEGLSVEQLELLQRFDFRLQDSNNTASFNDSYNDKVISATRLSFDTIGFFVAKFLKTGS